MDVARVRDVAWFCARGTRLGLALVAFAACKDGTPSAPPELQRFVDELVPADHGRELRVVGTIEGPIRMVGAGPERTIVFGLEHGGKHLRVITGAMLPDRFREHMVGIAVGQWLAAGDARPIVIARHLDVEGELFDAREVLVRVPDF